jgi:hypothetical protein
MSQPSGLPIQASVVELRERVHIVSNRIRGIGAPDLEAGFGSPSRATQDVSAPAPRHASEPSVGGYRPLDDQQLASV